MNLDTVLILIAIGLTLYGLVRWYRHTEVVEGDATVHLQSEHEHFHLHVDLPPHLQIQPGDTLQILTMPNLDEGRTAGGELSYPSRVRLYKASWLQRQLIRNSSLIEVKEIVEHP
jgi:hypothetical protein